MATTKLKGIIKRSIKVYGVTAPVVLSITEIGLEMAVKGFKTKVFCSWDHVARHMLTPGSVPSYLEGKPIEFLKSQAVKLKAKEEKDIAS